MLHFKDVRKANNNLELLGDEALVMVQNSF
jgi:hypothetical protein